MGKTLKIVICGATGVGKTAIVENVVYGDYANKELNHTKEDVYLAQVETERGVKENVRIQDTCGSDWLNSASLPKHYFHFGEGFILVYSVTDRDSFRCVEAIKREIEKNREKKEIAIAVIGNKTDQSSERQVDQAIVQRWAAKEKVRVFDTSLANRISLVEPFVYVCSRLTQPAPKSTLLGSRRMKQQASID